MKWSGYLKLCLFSVAMLSVPTLPGFAQGAQARIRTQPEFDSYNACLTEKDFAKRAGLCQKFVDGFKDSDFLVNGYKMIIQAYYETMNWQLLMDAADKATALPVADNSLKEVAYESAMVGAKNTNNLDKCISYGDKVLAIDPDNLDALFTVSTVIPQKSSTDMAQLNRAAEMARKALNIAATMLDKATPQDKPQLVLLDGTLHGTLGLISYDEKDYKVSIQEYQTALQENKKDDASHFFLAYDYYNLMAQASTEYQTSLKAENEAKAAKADQPTIDEAAAKRAGLEEDVRKYRDLVIDELAVAVAIDGRYAAQAKTELTKQWMAKNNDTTGMGDFINQKKAELGR